jgi:hypothetical protein
MSRRLLQFTTTVLAIATIVLGGLSFMLGIDHPIYGGEQLVRLPVLDSNLRFFGGLGLGLGAILLWIVPTIERQAVLFRAVWFCAFLGGLGRLFSAMLLGVPSLPIFVFSVVEVVGAPVLVYWQYSVARDRSER